MDVIPVRRRRLSNELAASLSEDAGRRIERLEALETLTCQGEIPRPPIGQSFGVTPRVREAIIADRAGEPQRLEDPHWSTPPDYTHPFDAVTYTKNTQPTNYTL